MTAISPLAPGELIRPPRRSRFHRPSRTGVAQALVFLLIAGFLILPFFAMAEFSTRGPRGSNTRTFDAFLAIGSNSQLLDSIVTSLQIALATVVLLLVLLVPTMTWAHLRVPRMRRVIEFICLLPLAVPGIVIVVGIAPIYRALYTVFGSSALTLTFIDVILCLPFAYRAIDGGLRAIDVATLAEAARSLGAGWLRVIFQIIVPNIRGGILSASVLAIALVLGEYTISSLLNFNTFQVVIALLGKRNAFVSVAVSLAALIFAFVLIYLIAWLAPGGGRSRRQIQDEEA